MHTCNMKIYQHFSAHCVHTGWGFLLLITMVTYNYVSLLPSSCFFNYLFLSWCHTSIPVSLVAPAIVCLAKVSRIVCLLCNTGQAITTMGLWLTNTHSCEGRGCCWRRCYGIAMVWRLFVNNMSLSTWYAGMCPSLFQQYQVKRLFRSQRLSE